MEFEIKLVVFLDRPIIPLYIWNIEEIGGVLKEVKWALFARLLQNYGKHFKEGAILIGIDGRNS